MPTIDTSALNGLCRVNSQAILSVLNAIAADIDTNSMLVEIFPFPGNPSSFPQTRLATVTNLDANRSAVGVVFAACNVSLAQTTAQRVIGHRLKVNTVEVGQNGLDATGTEPGWNVAWDNNSTSSQYEDKVLPLILAKRIIAPNSSIDLDHLIDYHPFFGGGSDAGAQSESTIIGFIGGRK